MLYIVSTPIGNLKDFTFRAVETLQNVDLIAAEDTRHTQKLLTQYNITKPLTSYFDHNEFKKGEHLIQLLKEGKNIALVTDAGTPGISDPGYRLINLAKSNGVPIEIVPGATALIAGLSLSGLPSDAFIFEGFLPVKTTARKKKLAEFKQESRTVIFYESPHRLVKSLTDIQEILNDPLITVARELTKKFQEVQEGPASQILSHFSRHQPKGEFVILFNLKKQITPDLDKSRGR